MTTSSTIGYLDPSKAESGVPIPQSDAYSPVQVPENLTNPQPPAGHEPLPDANQQGPRMVPGAKGQRAGSIAFIADNILKGFSRGRAQADEKKAQTLGKLSAGLQLNYQMASQRYVGLAQIKAQGGEVSDADLQAAQGASAAAYASWMKFVGNQLPQQKGKGKNGGGPQLSENPQEDIMSGDKARVAQGWYTVALKGGDPAALKVRAMNTPVAQAANEYQTGTLQNDAARTKAQAEYNQLATSQTPLNEDQKKRMLQLKEFLQTAASSGQKITRPVKGEDIRAAKLPEGSLGADGQPITAKSPDDYYYPMYGENGPGTVVWYPADPKQRPLKNAGPTGAPQINNYQPVGGTLGPKIADVPVPAQLKTIQTTDENQNPITHIEPMVPPFKKPEGMASSTPASTETGNPGTPGTPAPSPENKPEHKSTPSHHGEGTSHSQAPANPSSPSTNLHNNWSKFSEDTRKKFNAVNQQELTLNGEPGSKTDIGFKQATLNAMDNPDSNSVKNIAVAMRALDTYAKESSSAIHENDDGWIAYLKNNISTIPALQEAFSKLDDSGREYLDNFFRAWTNVAVIRALSGTSGTPTQGMYGMLVNELPMIGVNVKTKEDAERKLQLLQDEVDRAKSTLPADAQKQLARFSQKDKEGAAPTPPPKPGKKLTPEEEENLIKSLLDKYGTKPATN